MGLKPSSTIFTAFVFQMCSRWDLIIKAAKEVKMQSQMTIPALLKKKT